MKVEQQKSNNTTKDGEGKKSAKDKLAERPVRPRNLRGEILRLHALLAVLMLAFVAFSLTLKHEVKEGYYEKKDGTLIKLEDFDPVELGPFPRCHEHHKEHFDGNEWIKNEELDDELDDYPVGHPKNKAWLKKREEMERETKLTVQAIQPSIHLLLISVTVVYLGCRHAVWLYARPCEKLDTEDTEAEEDLGQSALQDSDAYWFPIMGSCVLFGLFIVYKYLDSEWIKYLFSCYVVVMCTNGLGINLGQIVAVYFNSRGLARYKTLFKIPYFDVKVTWIDIVSYMISAALGFYYIQTKNWIVNNLMGVSFCLLGLKHIGISSYKTGLIMLCGLFVYDVFWVFYSQKIFKANVMVAVATGVEAPIKLMFPRSQDGCGDMMFSMLGLGDIVVPGLHIALLSKFDLSRPDANPDKPSSPYLNVTMIFYTLSLVTTVLVMLIFNHAQPALLYIVPYILIGSFAVAVVKKQIKPLMDFVVEDTMISLEEEFGTAKAKNE